MAAHPRGLGRAIRSRRLKFESHPQPITANMPNNENIPPPYRPHQLLGVVKAQELRWI
jgi:hypothetical protein